MGFFDVLKNVAKAVESVSNAVNKNEQGNSKPASTQHAQQSRPAPRPASEKKTKQTYFDFANAQPMAEKMFEGSFYDSDASGNEYNVAYSFMATEDFEEADSGALEIDMVLGFHGNCDDMLDMSYCPPHIIFCNAPEAQVMNPVKKCLAGESSDNVMMFMRVTDVPMAVCKAKVKAFGQIYYLYSVKRGFSENEQYIAACYGTDAVGTALEQRLIDAVDNIVRTYKETPERA